MDRAARCSQPATRNVGDPAKGCCVRIRVGYPRQGAGTSVREGPQKSQNEGSSAPTAGQKRASTRQSRLQMMMTSPRISEHGQMPPINFAYRAGSAENMSNGRLLMQKVWSETFPTDRRAANHSIGQALLPTNEMSTACLYPSTPWLPLCLTGGLRRTEPGASAEASKRYPSTRTNRGGVCAAAMYKKHQQLNTQVTTHRQRTNPAKAPVPGHRQATKTVKVVGGGSVRLLRLAQSSTKAC
ncbi:hypothetical protein KCU81_g7570, partial [Aureobasidium melanogenum]